MWIGITELSDSNAVYYYHFDGLGSVVALTDANGTTVQTYEYSVYGHVAASSLRSAYSAASSCAAKRCFAEQGAAAKAGRLLRRTGRIQIIPPLIIRPERPRAEVSAHKGGATPNGAALKMLGSTTMKMTRASLVTLPETPNIAMLKLNSGENVPIGSVESLGGTGMLSKSK